MQVMCGGHRCNWLIGWLVACAALTLKYGEKDVCLYALSVGAASDPLDRDDLNLTYEMSAAGLRVLPSFAVLFPHTAMAEITLMPSLKFNPMMLLHGEQELVLPNGPLPPAAAVVTRVRITNVYDKGSGAVIMFEAVTTESTSGLPIAINRYVPWPSNHPHAGP